MLKKYLLCLALGIEALNCSATLSYPFKTPAVSKAEEIQKILVSEIHFPLPQNTDEALYERAEKNANLIQSCNISDHEATQLWALFLYNAMCFQSQTQLINISPEFLRNKLYNKELKEEKFKSQLKRNLKAGLKGACIGAGLGFIKTRPKLYLALSAEALWFLFNFYSRSPSFWPYKTIFSVEDMKQFAEKKGTELQAKKIYAVCTLAGAIAGILYHHYTYDKYNALNDKQLFLVKLSSQTKRILKNYAFIAKTYSALFPREILELNEEFKKIECENKYETYQEVHYLEFKDCLIQLAEFHKKLKVLAGL